MMNVARLKMGSEILITGGGGGWEDDVGCDEGSVSVSWNQWVKF